MYALKDGDIKIDYKPIAKKPTPKNKLSKEERSEIIEVANSTKFADLHQGFSGLEEARE